MKGTVFHIQRFSIHDGPGIRTTIFLKGCTLNCFWCHNPEGINPLPEIQFYPDLCINCKECIAVCAKNAHVSVSKTEAVDFLRDRCVVCGKCVSVCPPEAMKICGKEMTVDEVMHEIMLDYQFYLSSHGGVTLSGGEPVLQHAFAKEILKRCKKEGIHTAIETAGNYPWVWLEKLLDTIDLVMMDLKLSDSEQHKLVTGADNRQIIKNAEILAKTDTPIIFRLPIIPTVNDNITEIKRIRDKVIALKKSRENESPIHFELLKYHPLAFDKYISLNRMQEISTLIPPTKDEMDRFNEIAKI